MASGDTLNVFTPLQNEPPASIYATLDVRNLHPVLDFDGCHEPSSLQIGQFGWMSVLAYHEQIRRRQSGIAAQQSHDRVDECALAVGAAAV